MRLVERKRQADLVEEIAFLEAETARVVALSTTTNISRIDLAERLQRVKDLASPVAEQSRASDAVCLRELAAGIGVDSAAARRTANR